MLPEAYLAGDMMPGLSPSAAAFDSELYLASEEDSLLLCDVEQPSTTCIDGY